MDPPALALLYLPLSQDITAIGLLVANLVQVWHNVEMEANAYKTWWELHLRVARGDTLMAEEQATYDAGIQELDREEKIEGNIVGLRQLRASLAQLEAENARLREESERKAENETRLSTDQMADRDTDDRGNVMPDGPNFGEDRQLDGETLCEHIYDERRTVFSLA